MLKAQSARERDRVSQFEGGDRRNFKYGKIALARLIAGNGTGVVFGCESECRVGDNAEGQPVCERRCK